jgi:hypothetical protein
MLFATDGNRAADPNEATKQLQTTLANALMNAESRDSGAGGKILLPDPRPKPAAESGSTPTDAAEPSPGSSRMNESDPIGSQARSKHPPSFKAAPTLSNKSKSTLVSLGIPEPYFTIKSKRRSRRPFTPAEDEALLKGYAVHGFQWTLIQQDTHLNLSHRRATDLRDRFRTKFPHAYREGGSVSGKTIETQLNRNVGSVKQSLAKAPILPDLISTTTTITTTITTTPPSTEKRRKANGNLEIPSTGPIDAAMLPPAPPAGTTSTGGVFPFVLEEGTAGVTSTSSSSWEDNTLPPLVWDELG